VREARIPRSQHPVGDFGKEKPARAKPNDSEILLFELRAPPHYDFPVCNLLAGRPEFHFDFFGAVFRPFTYRFMPNWLS
jgi:hypothetical protein